MQDDEATNKRSYSKPILVLSALVIGLASTTGLSYFNVGPFSNLGSVRYSNLDSLPLYPPQPNSVITADTAHNKGTIKVDNSEVGLNFHNTSPSQQAELAYSHNDPAVGVDNEDGIEAKEIATLTKEIENLSKQNELLAAELEAKDRALEESALNLNAIQKEQMQLAQARDIERVSAEKSLNHIKDLESKLKRAKKEILAAQNRARTSIAAKERSIDSIVFKRIKAYRDEREQLLDENKKWAISYLSIKKEKELLESIVNSEDIDNTLVERALDTERMLATLQVENDRLINKRDSLVSGLQNKISSIAEEREGLKQLLADRAKTIESLMQENNALNASYSKQIDSLTKQHKDEVAILEDAKATLLSEKEAAIERLAKESSDKIKTILSKNKQLIADVNRQNAIEMNRVKEEAKHQLDAKIAAKEIEIRNKEREIAELRKSEEGLYEAYEVTAEKLSQYSIELNKAKEDLSKFERASFEAQRAVHELMEDQSLADRAILALQDQLEKEKVRSQELSELRATKLEKSAEFQQIKDSELVVKQAMLELKEQLLLAKSEKEEIKRELAMESDQLRQANTQLRRQLEVVSTAQNRESASSSASQLLSRKALEKSDALEKDLIKLKQEAKLLKSRVMKNNQNYSTKDNVNPTKERFSWKVKAASAQTAFIINEYTGKSMRVEIGSTIPGCGVVSSIHPKDQHILTSICKISG